MLVSLPQVSMTLAANFATSTTGVVDTGCQLHRWQITTGFNDTSGKNGNNIKLLTP
jgi:hypothetical protein